MVGRPHSFTFFLFSLFEKGSREGGRKKGASKKQSPKPRAPCQRGGGGGGGGTKKERGEWGKVPEVAGKKDLKKRKEGEGRSLEIVLPSILDHLTGTRSRERKGKKNTGRRGETRRPSAMPQAPVTSSFRKKRRGERKSWCGRRSRARRPD